MLGIRGVGRDNGGFLWENLDDGGFWKKSIPHFSQKFAAPMNQSV